MKSIGFNSDELFAKGLISGDNAKTLKNSMKSRATRALQLINFILDRVERNPREYDAFIDVLNEDSSLAGQPLLRKEITYHPLVPV